MTKLGTKWLADVNSQINLIDQGEIRLLSVLAANGDYCGTTTLVDVDDASTVFGSPLYMASDGNMDRCDASAIATMPCRAVAVDAGSGSNKLVILDGFIRNTSWSWTVGGEIYVSETTGTYTQTPFSTADSVLQSVGFAWTSDIMRVKIGAFTTN